jgi:hypothetical protein
MQIVALIEDGCGRLTVTATRSPDQYRRQVSAATGSAHLRWCGVPPEGIGAKAIAMGVRDRFGLGADGAISAPVEMVIKALVLATARPARQATPLRCFRRWIRRQMTILTQVNLTG